MLKRLLTRLWSRKSRSILISVFIHSLFIIIPLLLGMMETVQAYRLPYGHGLADAGGGGQPKKKQVAAQVVQRSNTRSAKPREAKKLKGVIFSPDAGRENSPEQKMANILNDIDKEAQHEYSATTGNAGLGHGPGTKKGGMGAGGEGPGGWPDGMKDYLIRFIRLEYQGVGWDDGMDESRSDANFLQEFGRITSFKVAEKGESIPIHKLKLFRKGEAPPFVFMKGEGHIEFIPQSDTEILRAYLMHGGMIFADAGCMDWGRDFENYAANLIPGQSLIDIPDDDPIYQAPYEFPNGAPPMWHHAGMRAKGLKFEGRWCVFYHPGDIGDAWKTGNDGLTPEKAEVAFHMGINVLYYAFTHYLEISNKK